MELASVKAGLRGNECLQIEVVKKALAKVPEETKSNVEKKQSRTFEELQAEQAEHEQVCKILKSWKTPKSTP